MDKELEEKYEKFKLNSLEYLEKFVFCNMANTNKEELAIKYAELLVEIQKLKNQK